MTLEQYIFFVIQYTSNKQDYYNLIDTCCKVLTDKHLPTTHPLLTQFWKLVFLVHKTELLKQSKHAPKHQYDDTVIGTAQRWCLEPERTRNEVNTFLEKVSLKYADFSEEEINTAYKYR